MVKDPTKVAPHVENLIISILKDKKGSYKDYEIAETLTGIARSAQNDKGPETTGLSPNVQDLEQFSPTEAANIIH